MCDRGGRQRYEQTKSARRHWWALQPALLSWFVLDRLLDLLLHSVQVEGGGILHWWVIDRRLGELRNLLLNKDKAPELSSIEIVHVAATHVVQVLGVDGWRALKGVLADIHHARHIRRDLRAGPALGLAKELEFEIIDPHGAQLGSREIEELMALRWSLVHEEFYLVVAVQVVLVGSIAKLDAFE